MFFRRESERHTNRYGRRGATLVELMIAVIIVGILAAVAIPVFSDYMKESRFSEAATNIQGILEAQQAYYTRFQRYTRNLGFCPENLPIVRWTTQPWPKPEDLEADCAALPTGTGVGWRLLGWEPDGPVHFRYRVFSHNSEGTACDGTYAICASGNCCETCDPDPTDPTTDDQDCKVIGLGVFPADSGLGTDVNSCGIDWDAEGFSTTARPWCVVEAEADMDRDNNSVFIRGNSYNNRIYRFPVADVY